MILETVPATFQDTDQLADRHEPGVTRNAEALEQSPPRLRRQILMKRMSKFILPDGSVRCGGQV